MSSYTSRSGSPIIRCRGGACGAEDHKDVHIAFGDANGMEKKHSAGSKAATVFGLSCIAMLFTYVFMTVSIGQKKFDQLDHLKDMHRSNVLPDSLRSYSHLKQDDIDEAEVEGDMGIPDQPAKEAYAFVISKFTDVEFIRVLSTVNEIRSSDNVRNILILHTDVDVPSYFSHFVKFWDIHSRTIRAPRANASGLSRKEKENALKLKGFSTLWSLDEYEKIIFLSGDGFFFSGVQRLFGGCKVNKYPERVCALKYNTSDYLKSALIVLSPRASLYEKVEKYLRDFAGQYSLKGEPKDVLDQFLLQLYGAETLKSWQSVGNYVDSAIQSDGDKYGEVQHPETPGKHSFVMYALKPSTGKLSPNLKLGYLTQVLIVKSSALMLTSTFSKERDSVEALEQFVEAVDAYIRDTRH